ncbi:MAG: hypothetical protein ACTSRD_07565 [Promethearchaeota archaeon]
MVTIISDTYTIVHFILTCLTMLGLLVLIILLDYKKMDKKKKLVKIVIGILVVIGGLVLGIVVRDTVLMLQGTPDNNTSFAIHLIAELTGVFLAATLGAILLLERIKKIKSKKTIYTIIFTILALMVLLLTSVVIILTFFLPGPIEKNSLHIGSIIGFPALILLSVGTILVISNEPKYVMYHGLTAGSAWILTTLNVITLFTLSEIQMTAYSGIIHTTHIVCGAVGLISGFLSALFGISGQRKLAKLSGYITLGCWWTAYLVSTFIANV